MELNRKLNRPDFLRKSGTKFRDKTRSQCEAYVGTSVHTYIDHIIGRQ